MPINSISNSGAKLLDILDTDHYTVKTGYEERFCGNTYYCKVIQISFIYKRETLGWNGVFNVWNLFDKPC